MSTRKFTASGTINLSGGGGGRVALVVVIAIPVILILEWIFGHAYLLLGVTVAIAVAGVAAYIVLVRYWERRGVIVAAGFTQLHATTASQLPPRQQYAPLTGGVHLHLDGPEAVELARQLVIQQPALLPAERHQP